MNYEQFLEQMKEDLQARFAEDLPPELADVRIGIRNVEKLQGESYRGLSFRSGDSPVEANLNMTGAFQAYEAGRPYEDILEEVEAQLMKVVDRTPQFNIGELTDYEAMKPKLMMEVIPQKGNEDRLENIPHQKVEDMALVYRLDMGDSAGGKMTSVITNQQLKSFDITAEQLHQDALENAPLTHPASLRSMQEVIASILRNPIYKGDHVVCKTHQKGIRSNTYNMIPRDQWEIVEGAHEAIIPKEDWERVQQIIDRRPPIMQGEPSSFYNLFHGLLYCADCGKSM